MTDDKKEPLEPFRAYGLHSRNCETAIKIDEGVDIYSENLVSTHTDRLLIAGKGSRVRLHNTSSSA